MKLSIVAAALGHLCLLHAGAFPVLEEESPVIIGPDHIQMKACPGKPLVLNCEAYPGCENDLTLIYWLVNGSFPEVVFSSDRVVETEESTLADGAILQRSLLVKNITPEDLSSTFMCVVINPTGMAQKHITLTATSSDPRLTTEGLNVTAANAETL